MTRHRTSRRTRFPLLDKLMIPATIVAVVGAGVAAAVTINQRNSAPDPQVAEEFNKQDLIVYAGDSITWGAAASDPQKSSRPSLMSSQLGTRAYVVNKGVNGWKIIDVATTIGDVTELYRKNGRNIIIVHAGSNDLAQGALADNLLSVVKDYTTTLVGKGWHVAVGTILSRDLTAEQERQRQLYNKMLLGPALRRAGVVVIDYAAAQASGKIPLADGVHPGDAGYATMNRLEQPFVSAVLRGAK